MTSKASPPPEPDLPPSLDATARRQIAEAGEMMRGLVALVPRRFTYADEIALVFRPGHAR